MNTYVNTSPGSATRVTRPWEKYELELYEWAEREQDREDQWVELRTSSSNHGQP
jgi:hypothetical protein